MHVRVISVTMARLHLAGPVRVGTPHLISPLLANLDGSFFREKISELVSAGQINKPAILLNSGRELDQFGTVLAPTLHAPTLHACVSGIDV
jgi:hypothetical protein